MSKVHSFFSSGDVTFNFWRATQNAVIAYHVWGCFYCPDQQLVGKLLMSHTGVLLDGLCHIGIAQSSPVESFCVNSIYLCIYTDAYVLYTILGK